MSRPSTQSALLPLSRLTRLPLFGGWTLPSFLLPPYPRRSRIHQTCDEPVVQHEGDVTFVTPPWSSLDAGRATRLRRVLDELFSADRAVVLDIGSLASIDSRGLALLLTLGRRTGDGVPQLSVCSARPPVRRLLLACSLHRVVDILNDRAEAESFRVRVEPRPSDSRLARTTPSPSGLPARKRRIRRPTEPLEARVVHARA